MDHLYEKTLHSETIYEGRIINVRVEDVELPNGKSSKRELIDHPGAVAVIAITPDNKILAVRQYRKALKKAIVEIPAGKLEPGEKPEVTAVRELEEETGYTCESLDKLISFYTSPGFANELVHLYVAKGLEKKGEQAADEDEFLDVLHLSLEEMEEMLETEEIHDAKTAYALMYLKMK
ncbi:NUDIX domain-containing protein [Guptibacillus hwajinpoensis]|uniref:ADP-ribose pyrophosphatase n=1 Tax=Guptibacillus hwajinpoensis TaxID=208199 RepID=A0ABU0JXS8_9BACL|nr:NUDIX hydrolase [Alkalihalobacillus hemicentroti]MDQ0481890.1 ADP-ribose pyrophosphatase [Alkalihalobacillus hemicentroti]